MSNQQGKLTVRQPKYVFWAGIILPIGFILIPIVVHIFQSQNEDLIWIYLILGICSLISASLALLGVRVWLVTVENNQIKFRNIFGKIKTIPLESIGKVHKTFNSTNRDLLLKIVLYSKDDKIFLSLTSDFVGFDNFLKRLEQESIEFESF